MNKFISRRRLMLYGIEVHAVHTDEFIFEVHKCEYIGDANVKVGIKLHDSKEIQITMSLKDYKSLPTRIPSERFLNGINET
jgi:hypothetical protein